MSQRPSPSPASCNSLDESKLGLDDPIAKFVDGVPQGDKITLRQLARMQSGLANFTVTEPFQKALFADPQRSFTRQELLGWAFAAPSSFPPGEGFEYCNTNLVLLGQVVEKVSGQPLPDYIRDRISVPLGMRNTTFPITNAFPGARTRRGTPNRPPTVRKRPRRTGIRRGGGPRAR